MQRFLGFVAAVVLVLGLPLTSDAQSPSVGTPFIGPGSMVNHPYGFYSGGYYGLNGFANVSTPIGTPAYPRGVNPVNPHYRGAGTAQWR